MAAPLTLTAVKGGIDRQRTKGGARADLLFDLLNGYVSSADTVKVRPGTRLMRTLPEGTKGLAAHAGKLHVFANEPMEELSSFGVNYVTHVLAHPDDDGEDAGYELADIHFAEPFMGFLYVVGEFANGDVYHYWLQTGGAWQANTVYHHGDMIEPTEPNGLAYTATRLDSPKLSWAPGVPRADGDEVEPTVYNDYYYTVVETVGANPVSGATEPEWPRSSGARVTEDTSTDPSGAPGTTPPPDTQVPISEVAERYYSGS